MKVSSILTLIVGFYLLYWGVMIYGLLKGIHNEVENLKASIQYEQSLKDITFRR